MRPQASERITLVEVFELTGSFDAFSAIVQAAARRLESEGVRGLVGVQFYGTPGALELGALVTFADSSQLMEHIRMITGWPEFAALLGVIKPLDIRVYGRLTDEALAWLRTMSGVSKIFDNPVAGFVREAAAPGERVLQEHQVGMAS